MAHPLSRRRLLTAGAATLAALTIGTRADATARPTSLTLPNGWQPEGIAVGAAPYAYLGSLADGSIYRADLRTGTGKVISTGPGTPAVGLKVDAVDGCSSPRAASAPAWSTPAAARPSPPKHSPPPPRASPTTSC
ncbi:hypothetical protein ABZ357_03480 [Streptomyces sp. NPDC005917]|uniref:hypothetical protein n=1 Tax=unclassified Streptomyces TaxID=2593676 RepID=UPI003400C2C3